MSKLPLGREGKFEITDFSVMSRKPPPVPLHCISQVLEQVASGIEGKLEITIFLS